VVIPIANPLNHRRIPWHFISLFAFLAISIGLSGYLYYEKQKEHIKSEKQDQLLAIADLKVGQIEKWRQERLNDAIIISSTPFVASHVQEFLEKQKAARIGEEVIKRKRSTKGKSYSLIFTAMRSPIIFT
jgi:hypothetical protein